MIPSCSCATPGRKPGTSTKVRIGMSKASQKRTKRAAFFDDLMSSTPASTIGWLATMPTVRPSIRPKPVMMLAAWAGWISKKSPSSTHLPDQLVHVVGLGWRCPGSRCRGCPPAGPRDRGRAARADRGGWRAAGNRRSRGSRASASMSFSKATSATPDLVVWVTAPPSSSWVTTSLVTVFTTSGPVTNM